MQRPSHQYLDGPVPKKVSDLVHNMIQQNPSPVAWDFHRGVGVGSGRQGVELVPECGGEGFVEVRDLGALYVAERVPPCTVLGASRAVDKGMD